MKRILVLALLGMLYACGADDSRNHSSDALPPAVLPQSDTAKETAPAALASAPVVAAAVTPAPSPEPTAAPTPAFDILGAQGDAKSSGMFENTSFLKNSALYQEKMVPAVACYFSHPSDYRIHYGAEVPKEYVKAVGCDYWAEYGDPAYPYGHSFIRMDRFNAKADGTPSEYASDKDAWIEFPKNNKDVIVGEYSFLSGEISGWYLNRVDFKRFFGPQKSQ